MPGILFKKNKLSLIPMHCVLYPIPGFVICACGPHVNIPGSPREKLTDITRLYFPGGKRGEAGGSGSTANKAVLCLELELVRSVNKWAEKTLHL